jgi:hypothetical protein
MKQDVTKIIGYILLTPSLISVLMFLAQFFKLTELNINFMDTLWTGTWNWGGESGGGGYTSALPLYFGLMAIAGAYLIKDKKQ